MFIDFIDIELQRKIANTDNFDTNTAKTVKTLLEEGPPNLLRELND